MKIGVAIHDFAGHSKASRGWRAFAHHDDERGRSVNLFGGWYKLRRSPVRRHGLPVVIAIAFRAGPGHGDACCLLHDIASAA